MILLRESPSVGDTVFASNGPNDASRVGEVIYTYVPDGTALTVVVKFHGDFPMIFQRQATDGAYVGGDMRYVLYRKGTPQEEQALDDLRNGVVRSDDELRKKNAELEAELRRWRRSFDGHVYVAVHKYAAMAAALRFYGDEDNWRQAEYDYTTFWSFLKNEEPWKQAKAALDIAVDPKNACAHCGQPKMFSERYPDGYCLCPEATKP